MEETGYKKSYEKVKYKELISIIVPVYNVREYLQGCTDSLLVQTYINLEILLVDDGSTDGSEVLCDRAALANDRVTVIHQKNGGLSSARNVGTLRAKGDWIVYVDSDDVVSPHFLEHLYNAAQLNESDMAICHGTVFAENGVFPVAESNHVTILDSANAVIELLSERRASTAAWGKLARSSFWKEFPFPEDRRFEDLAVTWKALNKANSVAFLEGSYYWYRNRLKSISSFPQLKSIVDYETSIQQVWLELIPSSNRMLKAKCFRCCLEYCRLLEMISSLSDSRIFDKNVEQTLVNVRNHSVGFLRRYGAKALGNMAASFLIAFVWSWDNVVRVRAIQFVKVSFSVALRAFKESSIFFLSNAATTVFNAFTTLMIGIYVVNHAQISYWAIAMTAITAVQSLYTPVTNSLYPHIVKSRDTKLSKKFLIIGTTLVLVGTVAFAFCSKLIMWVLGGPSYIAGSYIIVLLSPVLLLSFPSMLIGFPFLAAVGKVRELTISSIAAAIFHIVGLFLLGFSGMFSISAVALLRCATEAVMLGLRILFTRRTMAQEQNVEATIA